MAKRSRRHFVTKYPHHHEVVDRRSRSLTGKVGPKVLTAIANKLLGEKLIEHQQDGPTLELADLKQPLKEAVDGIHNIVDRPAEMIGSCQSLRPLWHGRA